MKERKKIYRQVVFTGKKIAVGRDFRHFSKHRMIIII